MKEDKQESIPVSKYWNRFWTVPNGFTLFRIASSLGLVACLAVNGLNPLTCFGVTSNWWLPSWAIATACSDFIDGTLARTLHQQSKWGQALDPIADKVLNWGIALTLMASGAMPLWVLTIGARDLAVGVFTAKRKYEDGLKKNKCEKKVEPQEKKNLSTKIKDIYHTFRKGEAPSPTYPAKMKMALQSVGAIATLAFGFGSASLPLLGGVMTGSIAAMAIPKTLPLNKKVQQAIQFLLTLGVTSIGIVLGGPALVAPIMMSSAISMAIPEVFAIKDEYFDKKKLQEEKQIEVVPKKELEENKDTNQQIEKAKEKVVNLDKIPNKKIDYSIIDCYIEEEMLRVNPPQEEKEYQKTKRPRQ